MAPEVAAVAALAPEVAAVAALAAEIAVAAFAADVATQDAAAAPPPEVAAVAAVAAPDVVMQDVAMEDDASTIAFGEDASMALASQDLPEIDPNAPIPVSILIVDLNALNNVCRI